MEGSDEDHTETQSQPSFKEQRQGAGSACRSAATQLCSHREMIRESESPAAHRWGSRAHFPTTFTLSRDLPPATSATDLGFPTLPFPGYSQPGRGLGGSHPQGSVGGLGQRWDLAVGGGVGLTGWLMQLQTASPQPPHSQGQGSTS